MAAELRARGVPLFAVVLESLSDDTLGNAYAARALHTEWRTDWRRLVLITSDFQARPGLPCHLTRHDDSLTWLAEAARRGCVPLAVRPGARTSRGPAVRAAVLRCT